MNLHKLLMLGILILNIGFVQAQTKSKSKSKPKPERAYVIHEKGQHMTKLSVIKDLRGKENTVQIEALNVSGGTARVVGETMPGADISDVVAYFGSFNSLKEVSKSGRGETVQLNQVVYPLKIRITISQQVLEVELKEEGYWKISVGLNQ